MSTLDFSQQPLKRA